MKYLILFLLIIILLDSHSTKLKANSTTIFISEILPDATGADAGKEWIEVYNNSSESFNMKDYYLINRSTSGTERKISITSSLSIPPKQYFLISEGAQNIPSENILTLGSGKINMFNDESDLELYDSDSALIDSIHYLKPTEAKSLERKGPESILDCNKLVTNSQGNTILTDNAARDPVCYGQASVTPPIEQPKDSCLSIGLITNSLVDSTICTRGYLSVEPDILGDKIFFIQDGGLGIKVKLKNALSLILKNGDKVEVTGVLKSVKDGLYLYADSLTIAGTNSSVFPSLLNDTEFQKYSLVEYTGEILKNYSKSIDLEFGDTTIRISVLASTGIEMPTRTVGDNLKVTGILVEEGGLFKILPRYQEDLEIQEKEEVVSKVVSSIPQKVDPAKSVDSELIKPVDTIVINKLPSLNINRIETSSTKLVKYSISRTLFLILLIVLLLSLLLIINRKKILEFIKKLKLVELKASNLALNSNLSLDFEKDKYEVMFGNSS